MLLDTSKLRPSLKKKAHNLNGWVELVTPYLEIIEIPKTETKYEDRIKLKKVFRMETRHDFFIWLSETHADDILFLGMNIKKLIGNSAFKKENQKQWIREVSKKKSVNTMSGINLSKLTPPTELKRASETSPAEAKVKSFAETKPSSITENEQAQTIEPQKFVSPERVETPVMLPPAPKVISKWSTCSIDHIIPIVYGGTNQLDNLCIIPNWINQLKHQFEATQKLIDPQRPTVYTLVPTRDIDGIYVTVPRFPDTHYRTSFPKF